MNQLQLFNHWFARMTAKYLNQKPVEGYTATIDAKEIIMGNTSGLYKETQKDKPSPVSQFLYKDFVRILPWVTLKRSKIERSFIGWTNSMEPTFDHGDVCLKTPYEEYKKQKGELRIGQIAVYTYGGSSIIHRYIGKTPEGLFVFKGDNNFRADPPVKEEQIEWVHIGTLHTWDKVVEVQD